jgi:Choline dehydrogenase and related flavoproteins
MLIDARQIPAGSHLEADVCIVGAGAAGLTIACELAGGPLKVCLLESGGFDFEDDTQALYRAKVTGHPINAPDISRLRYFGGTTNHWGGMCAPLDESDFAVRPWLQYSGWPIARKELDPYYQRAAPYVQIASSDFAIDSWASEVPSMFKDWKLDDRLAPLLFQLSPPTRFGEVYRAGLERDESLQVLLHANVLSFEADPTGRTVVEVRVGCLDGKQFVLRARSYILATGAIENARLLLNSNAVQPAGLGNAHDMVGRFFMGHPQVDQVARIVLDAPSNAAAKPLASTLQTYVMMQLQPATAAREQIARFAAHVDPLASESATTLHDTPAYQALKRLIARLKGTNFRNIGVGDDVETVFGDVGGLFRGLYTRFGSAPLLDIRPQCEQVPNPDSRIALNGDRDSLGLRQVDVNWQLTDLDLVGMRRGLATIGDAFARAGHGQMDLGEMIRDATPQSIECTEAWHHLGTTRMSEDPRTGVVDRTCRVHGVANLYVAGSSVFPTTGIVNPTYSIVALAIRLADHVRGQTV